MMTNEISCTHIDKNALQEVMDREVVLMRNLLTSLRGEHNAIKMQDFSLLDQVMEERVTLFGSFEYWSEKLIALTIKLAKDVEVAIRSGPHLRHSEALDILQECFDLEDFELLSSRSQILALIDEIHHQNDINAILIKDGVPEQLTLRIQTESKRHALFKNVVAVIDR